MIFGIKNFVGLCLVVSILPGLKANADYYNSALTHAYRTTQTTMQKATADGKTLGSTVTFLIEL